VTGFPAVTGPYEKWVDSVPDMVCVTDCGIRRPIAENDGKYFCNFSK
jgi:hypothetical protein